MRRRREQLEGFTPAEEEAMRSRVQQQIGRQTQQGLRQLRGFQGQAGIRGGLAGAQAADVLRQGQEAGTEAELDLQLQDMQARRGALDALERTARGEQDVERFNIQQAGREKFAQQATALSSQIVGAADRGAIKASEIAREQAAASQQGGKK